MSYAMDWKIQTLRDLATINYGRSPAAILADDGEYPVVGTGCTERRGADYTYDGESIILGRKGTIDKVGYATGRFWTIDTAYYLSDFSDSIPRWLFYFLQTLDLRQMNEATGVPSLSRDLLYKIEVETPPLTEQIKIAEILSTVDRAIGQTEALIAKQQRLKTGLMQDLLTRGIDEHGRIRSEETHEFKDSPLGRIPVEWEVQRLDYVASDVVDCPHTTPTFQPSGELVVRTFNIKDGHLVGERSYVSELEYEHRVSRCEPHARDLIFTREAPVGEAFIVPENLRLCLGQRTMLIRLVEDRCHPEYLLEVIYSEEMRIRFDQKVGGTTNPHLNVSDVRSLLLRIPDIKEQSEITSSIRSVRETIAQTQREKSKFAAIKTALMQDLLNGRKRVTNLLNKGGLES